MSQAAPLQATPLNGVHRAMGAKMVDFGGWDMPVQYSGILDEHHAVRRAVGLFDVSHMGEIEVRGPEASKLVDFAATNAVDKLKDGQAHYSALLYDHGGFVDDILVHKVSDTSFFLCVNASNQEKDFEHIRAANRFDCEVEFASPRYAQLAVQGPKALETLRGLTTVDLAAIRYYWFEDGEVCGIPARLARTGYTGEDGFELYVAPDHAERVWRAVLEAGAPHGIRPCGLGARNTLRLEAKMALYGHEIDATINPIDAGLEWIVKYDKGDFIGRDALLAARGKPPRRKLAGFEMTGRGIGRDGYEVLVDGEVAGWVTSGSPSPTLGKNIGLCYLPPAAAEIGRPIQILIRNQPADAIVAATPFYRRAK
ncbi:MAG: glycine cleavage system aminomethyltransferase GcvT [Bryobacterales bacterium]|nr:glycine cleavage system aminomethyltransferase GcvT [Bryobacterales bacterium]